jgi:hypothetical protein
MDGPSPRRVLREDLSIGTVEAGQPLREISAGGERGPEGVQLAAGSSPSR